MTLFFRPAHEADLEELITLHTQAFPDPRGHDARERNFTANPLGTLDDLWVAREGPNLVGQAFLFPLQGWFGGEAVRLGGIASVGVTPEARGRGVATALVGHLHDVARVRGDAITLLYPFREGFYARLGYGGTSPYRKLRFAPSAIPWKRELSVRTATGADRAALESCWQAAGAARTGSLVRSDRAWDATLLDARRTWLVADGGDGAEGYVAWSLVQNDAQAETTLVVDEMAACTDRAMRTLWATVASQRDQVAEVVADVSADDPLDAALIDADRPRFAGVDAQRRLGEIVGGPMVRIVDVTRALSARGWAQSGSVALDVEGERLSLTVDDGRGVVAATVRDPDLRLDIRALAAIAFGGLRVHRAARLGWVLARDPQAIEAADVLFALPPYFSPDRF